MIVVLDEGNSGFEAKRHAGTHFRLLGRQREKRAMEDPSTHRVRSVFIVAYALRCRTHTRLPVDGLLPHKLIYKQTRLSGCEKMGGCHANEPSRRSPSLGATSG